MRILLTNCHNYYNLGCQYNKGGSAVIISTINMLRKYIPDAEFSTFIQMPDDFANAYKIKIVNNKMFRSKCYSLNTTSQSSLNLIRAILWRITHKRFPLFAKGLVGNRELKEYLSADIIIDVSMDHYSDDFGFIAITEQSKDMLIGVFLGKPVIVWAQSVGPFRSRLTSWLVKYTLNKISMILLREDISAFHLKELGIHIPFMNITADPAFTMEPATKERASEILLKEGIDENTKLLAGMTISWTALMGATRRSTYLRYIESLYRLSHLILPEGFFNFLQHKASVFKWLNMSSFIKTEDIVKIINHLVEDMDASVVLIPHSVDPGLDDRKVMVEVLIKLKQSVKVHMLAGDYSAPELKAVIGCCDLFIGAKMHSNIASLSMSVPTIGIQYSYKFAGIMKTLGETEYICDDFNPEVIIPKIDKAWSNRELIKADLKNKLNLIKGRSFQNAKIVADFLSSRTTGNSSL
jgi:colanic acid/amylovoran biosynthesis protein